MSRVSPTAEGFRTAFRRPSLTLAEITWRWTVGVTACALLVFGGLEYLKTLPVSNGDLLFLRSGQPALVGQAISHILRGSLHRAVLAGMVGALALACLWILAASIGRAATVRALVEHFAEYFAQRGESGQVADANAEFTAARSAQTPWPLNSLLRLNFLRTALVLGALLGLQGAAILAGFVSTDAKPQPGLVFLIFLPLAALICGLWWTLNWFLSLAAVFAVRNNQDALGAISAAVTLCRERAAHLFAVSTWTGLAHLVALSGAMTVVAFPLGLAQFAPARVVFVLVLCVALIYFAVADWLHMARLAGYVCIAEMPEALLAPPLPKPSAPFPPPQPSPPPQTAIDQDEPILGDVPSPVVAG